MEQLILTQSPNGNYVSAPVKPGSNGSIALQVIFADTSSHQVYFYVSVNGTDYSYLDARTFEGSEVIHLDGLIDGELIKLECSVKPKVYAIH